MYFLLCPSCSMVGAFSNCWMLCYTSMWYTFHLSNLWATLCLGALCALYLGKVQDLAFHIKTSFNFSNFVTPTSICLSLCFTDKSVHRRTPFCFYLMTSHFSFTLMISVHFVFMQCAIDRAPVVLRSLTKNIKACSTRDLRGLWLVTSL